MHFNHVYMYVHAGNTLYLVAVLNRRKAQGQTTLGSVTLGWLFHLDGLRTSFVELRLNPAPRAVGRNKWAYHSMMRPYCWQLFFLPLGVYKSLHGPCHHRFWVLCQGETDGCLLTGFESVLYGEGETFFGSWFLNYAGAFWDQGFNLKIWGLWTYNCYTGSNFQAGRFSKV